MRSLLTIAILAVGLGTASARPMRSWSYRELADAADLIAIVTPTSTRARPEKAPLPDVADTLPTGKRSPVIGQRVETELGVSAILKGTPADPKRINLHHYALTQSMPMVNGPMLVSFEPKDKLQYLVFLRRGTDGQYIAVTGQTNPWFSVEKLQQRAP